MNDSILPARPLPESTVDSLPYWNGLREHRLRLQQCAACGKVRHYPRPLCAECYASEITWIDALGEGVVHSWTVAHHAFHPAFKADLPYVLVTVDLPQGVRMLAPLRGPASALRIGLAVRLIFEDVSPELTLPAFVVA